MLKVLEAKAKLEKLSKNCESETYVKEKEKCEMFSKHVKTKCKSEMQKYVKLKKKCKVNQVFKTLVALQNINDKFLCLCK